MASYLITGSSRGLGLALVSRLIALPASQVATVFATSRQDQPSANLKEIIDRSAGRVAHVQLNTTDQLSIKSAVQQVERQLQGRGLDVLINNAGVQPMTQGGVETMDNLTDAFSINVNATHEVCRAFLPLLRKGQRKVISNISTALGSIAMATPYLARTSPAYNITKAALNMLTKQYALNLEKEEFTVFCLSPGWLQTDMGGSGADLSSEEGAVAVLDLIQNANHRETNGRFLNIHVPGWEHAKGFNRYDGKEIPW
ncbi:hypothetical protein BDV25DRAFT_38344 [Aspergillus avenaceus]|uniref:Short chain oxidoreductase n=1 Tax=Aspergillus avenaceus TaxID=36643 RepID=A0A5N6U9D5_ASPAV|nr:hypothetical protein BDV25DRAFT_38344 [Aspergillus avenaceus]